MTRDEAIERFENVKANALVQKASGVSEYWQNEIDGTIEAIDMAIEALSVAELKSNFESAVPNCQKCAIKQLWEETEKEDLVSVVRCEDCRHRDLFSCPLADNDFQKDDDFCSWGERREE